MTLLLVMEALHDGRLTKETPVRVSAYAASMGGSQVYLAEGETMSVGEMIKCVVIASANDAAVALAEAVCGSEEAFVVKMNERARELGMEHTNFENVTGLDDDTVNHTISAEDIAIMSRALIAHSDILTYSSIWMDTIRDGAFALTNTNRLIRYYDGATGLKTGSTSKAGFCISATAKRENMHLIAVIMGASTRDTRNEAARKLLDWGFANYALYEDNSTEMEGVPVKGGEADMCGITHRPFRVLLRRGEELRVTAVAELPASLNAPIQAGDPVGRVVYRVGDTVVGECDITASEDIARIGYFTVLLRMIRWIFGGV